MKRSLALISLTLATVPLGACVNDGYSYGVGTSWQSSPYDVWYDGYYGSLYDGYWGTDGSFYYRLNERDRNYRRGEASHFRRDGNHYYRDRPNEPDPRFRRYGGNTRQPSEGTRMPNYPSRDRGGDGWRNHRDDDRRDRR